MSFNIRNIREISGDPFAKFATKLSKELSKFLNKQQTDKLENKEDMYSSGQDVDTVIKLHSELSSTKRFLLTTQFYPTFEPDGDKLRLWVRGVNLGNTTYDYSQFGNVITINGDPLLIDGTPFDLGIHSGGVKSIALRFNRPTSDAVNQEYISIPDDLNLQVAGVTTGISYFIRFRVSSLAQQGGKDRCLFSKRDDSTPNDAVSIEVSPTGRLTFHIRKAGSTFSNQTATGTIAVNTVYDVWCTYTNSGNVIHIYVNNVDKSLTDPGGNPFNGGTDAKIYLMRRVWENAGYVEGDLYDFRIYRTKVVSSTEVGYMNTNKWTIYDVPFGQVMVSNYWAAYV